MKTREVFLRGWEIAVMTYFLVFSWPVTFKKMVFSKGWGREHLVRVKLLVKETTLRL